MFGKTAFAAALLMLGLGSTAASADECSGRDHTAGTVLGAIAGGVLGGAVSDGNGGAVIGGALLGGLAGNAIARDMDCEDRPYAARTWYNSFQGPVGRRYSWNHGRNRGYVVSTREYRDARRDLPRLYPGHLSPRPGVHPARHRLPSDARARLGLPLTGFRQGFLAAPKRTAISRDGLSIIHPEKPCFARVRARNTANHWGPTLAP